MNALADSSDPLHTVFFSNAIAINNGGHILATGRDGDMRRVFALTPIDPPTEAVPEAGSLTLSWPAALAVMAGIRGRAQRRSASGAPTADPQPTE
jgi:hypothetical protein